MQLCHLEGLSRAEAAEVLRASPDAIRGRLERARALLRERLTDFIKTERVRSQLREAATRIRDENQQTVKQLSELIVSVAIPMKINDKISVQSSGQRRRWKSSDVYEESTCEVSFHQKEGYDFKDLCNFLRYVERQNPKVQIKAINFGSRDDDVGKDLWRPLSMTVRVFAPKLSRR